MPNGDNYTDTLPPQQQTTDALMLLWKEIGEEYDVGTYDEFKEYLSNDDNRKSFYEGVIEPAYDIESQEKFESIYDLKKKTRHPFLLGRKKLLHWIPKKWRQLRLWSLQLCRPNNPCHLM